MAVIYQFNNESHWQYLWGTSVNATPAPGNGNRYYPIAEIIVPLLLTNHVIGVFCQSVSAAPHWRLGGLIRQTINTGILQGGTQEATTGPPQKLWLNQVTTFEYPRYSASYGLKIKPPFWLQDFTVSVYEYTGPVTDTTEEKIDQLSSDLTTLHHEIDAYFGISHP